MGGGVSASIVAMAHDLNGEEKKRYKGYYNELAQKGFSEQRIRNELIDKLKNERSSNTKTRPKTSNRREISKGQKDSNQSKPVLPTIISEVPSCQDDSALATLPMPLFPVIETVGESLSLKDSTNSIKSFDCSLCKTTFKNHGQLDRHVKYSDNHALAVQAVSKANRLSTLLHTCIDKMKTKNNVDVTTEAKRRWLWAFKKVMLQLAIDRTTQILVMSLQKEVAPATLLFEGSKLFWKFQYTIQLHIYHHEQQSRISDGSKSSIIEIIGYCVSKHRELGRLYLAYSVLEGLLSSEITKKIAASQIGPHNRSLAAYRVSKNDNHIRDDTILNFILQHLQVEARVGCIAGVNLVFQSTGKEDDFRQLKNAAGHAVSIDKAIVPFASISHELRPMYIVRRRHSTEAERTETLAELKQHQSQLTHLTGHAEAVANILTTSMQTLSTISRAHEKRNRSGFSDARNHWFAAIHRTIVQSEVNRARYHLAGSIGRAANSDAPLVNKATNPHQDTKAAQYSAALPMSLSSPKAALASPGPHSLLKKAGANPATASGKFKEVAHMLSGKSTTEGLNKV